MKAYTDDLASVDDDCALRRLLPRWGRHRGASMHGARVVSW